MRSRDSRHWLIPLTFLYIFLQKTPLEAIYYGGVFVLAMNFVSNPKAAGISIIFQKKGVKKP